MTVLDRICRAHQVLWCVTCTYDQCTARSLGTSGVQCILRAGHPPWSQDFAHNHGGLDKESIWQYVTRDDSHVVGLTHADVNALRHWLTAPNGSLHLSRVTFEAVENGGILVRTDAWMHGNE